MAYAAITCLMRTIHQSMELTGCDLQPFYEKLESLRAILEKSCNLEVLTSLEAQITEVAYKTKVMVESKSVKVSLAKTAIRRSRAFWKLSCSLEQKVEYIDSFLMQWLAIQNWYSKIKDLKAQKFSLASIPEHAVEQPENIMAYTTITCLMRTINQSLELTGCDLQPFYEKLKSLRAILEESCNITSDFEALTSLEAEMAEVAYTTEEMVDSKTRKVLLAITRNERRIYFWELCSFLKQAIRDINSAIIKWMEMQNMYMSKSKDLEEAQNSILISTSQHAVEPDMVGHEAEFKIMQDELASTEKGN